MRAHRTMAMLATVGAMVVATAGAALVAPGVATAAPTYYPPPQSSLLVSAGSVRVGNTVRLWGRGYSARERVRITIRYRVSLRPGHWTRSTTVRAGSGRTDSTGNYRSRVRLVLPGYAFITVRGQASNKSAGVTVRVLNWRRSWPRQFRDSGFQDGATGTTLTTA